MSLDTIDTPVTHAVVQKYIAKLDERGEVYSFNVSSTPQPGKAIMLTLIRDGSDDPLEIRLDSNGQWSASHVLVIGETR